MGIRNQGPSKQKRDPPPPYSPPSEVEGIRIVVILLGNIAKKKGTVIA